MRRRTRIAILGRCLALLLSREAILPTLDVSPCYAPIRAQIGS